MNEALYPVFRLLCIAGIIYAVIMIAVWVCIGILGGPAVYLKPPKIPPMPPLPEMKEEV